MNAPDKNQDWLTKHAEKLGRPGWSSFQSRVSEWIIACFDVDVLYDSRERCHRFLEEALELVQAVGCSAHEAHQLVDYVYSRPVGNKPQELGGTMVTLAALATAMGYIVEDSAEVELRRNWQNMEKIKEKWLAKPKHSPLPMASQSEPSVVPHITLNETAHGQD